MLFCYLWWIGPVLLRGITTTRVIRRDTDGTTQDMTGDALVVPESPTEPPFTDGRTAAVTHALGNRKTTTVGSSLQ